MRGNSRQWTLNITWNRRDFETVMENDSWWMITWPPFQAGGTGIVVLQVDKCIAGTNVLWPQYVHARIWHVHLLITPHLLISKPHGQVTHSKGGYDLEDVLFLILKKTVQNQGHPKIRVDIHDS
jgi:hypothetical protein